MATCIVQLAVYMSLVVNNLHNKAAFCLGFDSLTANYEHKQLQGESITHYTDYLIFDGIHIRLNQLSSKQLDQKIMASSVIPHQNINK